MIKKHAYVVNWRDSASLQGWNRMGDNHSVLTITSIGFLVSRTKKSVTISTCVAKNGDVRDAVTIPSEAITRMKRLPQFVSDK